MEKSPKKSEYSESGGLKLEIIERFRDYVVQGGELIKQGKFGEAIEHFRNSDELKKINWQDRSGNTECMYLRSVSELGKYKCEDLADYVAIHSTSEGGFIEVSGIYFANSVPEKERVLPLDLQHEISLVYMEEWLHALQEIQKRPLVQGKSTFEQEEIEVDVAFYMDKTGIPMTKSFLKRYGRDIALEKVKQGNKEK
jgi:hypothetical protein